MNAILLCLIFFMFLKTRRSLSFSIVVYVANENDQIIMPPQLMKAINSMNVGVCDGHGNKGNFYFDNSIVIDQLKSIECRKIVNALSHQRKYTFFAKSNQYSLHSAELEFVNTKTTTSMMNDILEYSLLKL